MKFWINIMLSYALILKLLAPFVSAITIVVLTLIERKNKNRLYCWGAIVLAIILFIITSITTYYDHQSSIKVDNQRAEMTTMLQKSLAMQGDNSIYEIFVTSQRELINRISSKDSDDFIDELDRTYEERMEKRQNLDLASQKISMNYKIMLNPFKDFILSEFDDRMEKLIKKGYANKIDKFDYSAVAVDSKPHLKIIRNYYLNNGYQASIRMRPLRIDSGQLIGSFYIDLLITVPGSSFDRMFEINSSDNNTRLFPSRPAFGILEFSTTKSPMEDKEFLDKLVGAINKAVQYMVLEANVSKNK